MRAKVSLTATLRDGTAVLVRNVTARDAPLLRLGFAQLGARSRRMRFLRAVRALTEAELAFLADLEGEAQDAVGALDLSARPPLPAGIARFVRLPDRPDRAELAVTVVDAYQGRGLGSLLLGVMAWRAVEAGIGAFTALVSAENAAMLQLLDELGARVEADHGAERELALPLHADPARYPATPAGAAVRQAFALAAAGRGGGS